MASKLVPPRLRSGCHVRVVAPSRSLALISKATREIADARFADLGVRVSFGDHVEVSDRFVSSPVADRVADLHSAFADPDVDAVLTVIGGYNANQLLPYLDWDLIGSNPKILCGYSDITALTCAVTAMTGMVTYSGPHYSTFGMRDHFETSLGWFTDALFSEQPIDVTPAPSWTDDEWFMNQDQRRVRPNDGHWIIGQGHAEGRLVGGNLCTLNLLHGTPWMPDLADSVVFLEDDRESSIVTFDRDLTSLAQQPGFGSVRALLIGRFEPHLGMDRETLAAIVQSKRELDGIPVIANVDFGHTDPLLTIPVGGHARVDAGPAAAHITLES
ncbi:MAG: S66 peptidase family protein [Aquihabitans sp.]